MPVQRPYNPNAKLMAEMIQADWAKIGIKARIVSYEWGEYIKRAHAGEHDAMLFGWTGDNGDPDNWLATLYGCDSINGNNVSKWCDAAYDKLVKAAKRVSDQDKRSELYKAGPAHPQGAGADHPDRPLHRVPADEQVGA